MFSLRVRQLVTTCLLASLTLTSFQAKAEQDNSKRLSILDIGFKLPSLFGDAWDIGTKKENVNKWIAVGLLTAVTIPYDEEIYKETQVVGRRWGLATKDNLKPLIKLGDFTILKGPTDLSSGLYFLGDGWVHLGTAATFLLTGYALDANRPVNTAIQLFSGFTASTITSQLLKRASGREAPAPRTKRGGEWRPFPREADYQSHRTKYDAFPSGHVMTTTVTFTIIRANYPEYESILWPAQIIYTTALGFGMVNNGIHWAGDYPLGIMLGYVFGKAALRMTEKSTAEANNTPTALFEPIVSPTLDADGQLLTSLEWKF